MEAGCCKTGFPRYFSRPPNGSTLRTGRGNLRLNSVERKVLTTEVCVGSGSSCSARKSSTPHTVFSFRPRRVLRPSIPIPGLKSTRRCTSLLGRCWASACQNRLTARHTDCSCLSGMLSKTNDKPFNISCYQEVNNVRRLLNEVSKYNRNLVLSTN